MANSGFFIGAIILAFAISAAGCADPVAEERQSALGRDSARPGPTHRPGQPCGTCHDGTSEAREFSVAGTVYDNAESKKPVAGALVTMTDASGAVHVSETNCAGNFFVRPETWRPRFPMKVSVKWGSQSLDMESPIHREGSCAACHGLTTSPTSTGPVFLWDGAPPAGVPGGCP